MNEEDLKNINDHYEDDQVDELMQRPLVIVKVSKNNKHNVKFSTQFDSMRSLYDVIAVCQSMPQSNTACVDITIDSFEALLSILAYDMHLHEYLEHFDACEPDQAQEEMEYALEEIKLFISEFNELVNKATQNFFVSSVKLIRRLENPSPKLKQTMDKFEQMMCEHLQTVN